MTRPCSCDRVTLGKARRPGECLYCWRWHHRPGEVGNPAAPVPVVTPLPVLPACPHRGDPTGESVLCPTCAGTVRLKLFGCKLHGTATAARRVDGHGCCADCPDNPPPGTAGGAKRPPSRAAAPPAAAPVAAGVVFGCYLWPELIQLQCRLLRQTCGPDVPVLISWDHDPRHPDRTAAARFAAAAEGADFLTDARRRGHQAGDAAAFARGVAWAVDRGLAVLVKVSNRHVFTAPRWVQGAAADLTLSGLPVLGRGNARWPLRTEAVALEVARWSAPDVLADLRAMRHDAAPAGHIEHQTHRLLRERLGGAYLPWALLPADRETPKPDAVSPDAVGREVYEGLAARVGVVLPADFRAGGYQWQLARGEYDAG